MIKILNELLNASPLCPPGVCAINGLLYVIGGDDGSCNLSSVEFYNPATDKWSLIPTNMSNGRSYAGESRRSRRHRESSCCCFSHLSFPSHSCRSCGDRQAAMTSGSSASTSEARRAVGEATSELNPGQMDATPSTLGHHRGGILRSLWALNHQI